MSDRAQRSIRAVGSTTVEVIFALCALTACLGIWGDSLGYYTLPIERTPEFKRHQRVPGLLPPSDGRASLVLFIDSQCVGCAKARESYANLLIAADRATPVRLGFISLEPPDATRKVMRELVRPAAFVFNTSRDSLSVRTPTVLLVSRDDEILEQWFTPFTKEEIGELSSRLRELTPVPEVRR